MSVFGAADLWTIWHADATPASLVIWTERQPAEDEVARLRASNPSKSFVAHPLSHVISIFVVDARDNIEDRVRSAIADVFDDDDC